MTKLFVVGIPRDMDRTELMEIFSLHGLVDLVTVVTNIDTGESLGYGFVHMNDEAGAKRAIAALDGAEIDDRKISVRVAENKQEIKQEDTGPAYQKVAKSDNPVKKKRPRR